MTRLADDAFLVVTGTAFGSHDLGWLRRQARLRGAAVRVADVTGALGVLRAVGAARRATLLARADAGADLSNAAFPFMTCAGDHGGDVPVRALRVTFVGELGWELYCPDRVRRGAVGGAGRRAATRPGRGGYRAIESLRLEKGYRVWGTDIAPETTPVRGRAGLLRAARRGGFVGARRCVAAKARGVPAAALPDPGRPAGGRAGRRAGAGRRRRSWPG